MFQVLCDISLIVARPKTGLFVIGDVTKRLKLALVELIVLSNTDYKEEALTEDCFIELHDDGD